MGLIFACFFIGHVFYLKKTKTCCDTGTENCGSLCIFIVNFMRLANGAVLEKEKKIKKEGKNLRILVVDDEPLICLCVSRYLAKRALVKTAATADEALDEIGKQHYDLCFLDIIMPGTYTGLEAMKIIKEQYPNTKVAVMSATSLNETMKKEVGDYAFAYIQKPFNLSDVGAVAEIVEAAL